SADRLSFLPFTHRPALMLAMLQASDGTWNRSMLTVPSTRAEHFEGVGTISAVRRLLEYGWDKDTPPLLLARRVLFRLLAEGADQLALAGEAAPPSVHALTMLAYMPLFRTEHHVAMDRLYQHLSPALPRQDPVQLCGRRVMP